MTMQRISKGGEDMLVRVGNAKDITAGEMLIET